MQFLLASICLFVATSATQNTNQRTNPKCDAQIPYHHVAPQGEEATKYAVSHGQLVLLGTVAFRPSYFCNSTKGFCGTRKIHFDVSCVLKGDGLPVADYISIGNDRYDPLCDLTFIPAALNGAELIVIVKRDPQGVNPAYNFDWHEVIPQVSAYILSSHLNLVLQVCGVHPHLPTNTDKVNTCPGHNQTDCSIGEPHSWIQVANYGKYRISLGKKLTLQQASATCRAFGARLLYVDRRSEIEALLGALPSKKDMKWWTSGLIKDNKPYWEDYIYGDPIGSDITSWLHPNGSLPKNGQLLLTSKGWIATDDSKQKLPFICKLELKKEPVSFLSADFNSDMHLTVSYSMSDSSRWICCQNIHYKHKMVTSDTLTADMIQPYYMQKVPTLVLKGPGAPHNKYTYMMVDVTNPSSPYVHYLITNVGSSPQADVKGVLDYTAPLPMKMHHYLYLAFKQVAGTVYVNPLAFSDRHCLDRPRCKFYVSKFMEVHKLHLVAVTPITAVLDPYTVQQLIGSSMMSKQGACLLLWPNIKMINNQMICPSTGYTSASGSNTAPKNSNYSVLLLVGLIIVYACLYLD